MDMLINDVNKSRLSQSASNHCATVSQNTFPKFVKNCLNLP